MGTSPSTSTLRRLLVGCAAASALCALVEAGFRACVAEPEDAPLWVPDAEPGASEAWQRSSIHVADHHAFWRTRANLDAEHKGVRVRTNALGMRSRPVERAKPSGTVRVLCLGESSTFGAKVAQDEIYASVLQRLLDARGDGAAYEVLNAGTSGYSLVQSWQYLLHHGLELEPDVVVLYHGYNDFLLRSFVSQRVGEGAGEESGGPTDLELVEARSRWPARLGAWLVARSRALRVLARLRQPTPPSSAPVAETLAAGADPRTRVPRKDRLRALSEILALTRARSIGLLIVVPSYASFRAHREVLLRFGEQHGVPCLDVEELILRDGQERSRYFVDKVHPSPRLHRLLGEALHERLGPLLPPPGK
jgi:lysophospholipase L1-like esterase